MCAEPSLANTAPISDHSKIWAVVCSHPFLVAGVDFEVEVSDCRARCVFGTPGWREECGWQGGQSLVALEGSSRRARQPPVMMTGPADGSEEGCVCHEDS